MSTGQHDTALPMRSEHAKHKPVGQDVCKKTHTHKLFFIAAYVHIVIILEIDRGRTGEKRRGIKISKGVF